MGRYARLHRMPLAVGTAWLLAGCAGVMLGRPTPVPGPGPLNVPQPTTTQIAVGQNPSPSAPRMYPFVAQVRPSGAAMGLNSYRWLEDVHSNRTRHWILVQNRATAAALAAIPQRAWIRARLERFERAGRSGIPDEDVVERVSYLASDGTRLPMEIVHRRDLARNGDQPALLAVYRGGKPPGPLLEPLVLTWLEMGGVYVRAHVRGGLATAVAPRGVATMPDRSIALEDLFAAARYLFSQRYTRRGRLGIYGRGFGGLMAGAALTRRPGLFGVALPTGTWAQYRAIRSGSCFPPTLIVTAERYGDIRPWEGYELAAALQAEQVCGHSPILIRIASVGGAEESPPERREREADELGFAATWLGATMPGEAP